jgi:hypothetical protein
MENIIQTSARSRRPRKGQRVGISRAKYDELFSAFTDDQNPGRLAKKCRLDPRTIRRYVEGGDPTRGLRPLRERFAEIVAKVQAKEDNAVATARSKALAMVDRYLSVLEAKIAECFDVDGVNLTQEASAALPTELSGALDRTTRLKLSLLGEPDFKVEMTSEFGSLDEDEVREYLESGKLPKPDSEHGRRAGADG